MNYVNTHNLNTGDVVEYYGCKFKLTEKFNNRSQQDIEFDERGITWFKTECLEYVEGVMPKGWADSWIIQGNKNASWCVV